MQKLIITRPVVNVALFIGRSIEAKARILNFR